MKSRMFKKKNIGKKVGKSKTIGVLVMSLMLISVVGPMIAETSEASHNTANYEVVDISESGNYEYREMTLIDDHRVVDEMEVRSWFYEGQNAASSRRVTFTQLLQRDSDWDIEWFEQRTRAYGGSVWEYDHPYGTYSPYPLDGGSGYGSWAPQNSIGCNLGSRVEVPTTWRTADWDVRTYSFTVYHEYDDGTTSSFDGAHIGSAFSEGNEYEHRVEVDMIDEGWWILPDDTFSAEGENSWYE